MRRTTIQRQAGNAQQRVKQGWPVASAIADAQRAGPADIFVQTRDIRYIVRGGSGREHVFTADGTQIITSVNRSHAAHLSRLRSGAIRPASDSEYTALKEAIVGK